MERHSGVPQASRVLAATRSPRNVSDLIVSRQEKDDWMTTQITRKIIKNIPRKNWWTSNVRIFGFSLSFCGLAFFWGPLRWTFVGVFLDGPPYETWYVKKTQGLDVTDVSPTLWLSMKVVISTSTLQTEMFWWTFATWNPHLLSFAGYSKWCIHGFFREAVLTKWQGLVGILRTAVCRMWWRCFLWSGAGVTMQWWKWYLCRKQSFDDGSVSPLPKRRRVGKSCQTTGMPLSHVNEADSSGPEAHQPARPKGRAMVMFFEDLQSMSFDLCFLVLPKNLCFNAHKAPGVFLHCCYQGVRVLFTESYPLWRGAKWENKSTAAKPSAEFVTE